MEIVKQFRDGRIAVKKKARKTRICSGCSELIIPGEFVYIVQHLVIFRKKYWKDDFCYCEKCKNKIDNME